MSKETTEVRENLMLGQCLENKLKWRDASRQILASCISYLVVVQTGICMAFSGVLIPQLNSDESTVKISSEEASWIASFVTLFLPVGALSAGPIMDKFGRKWLTLVNCLPFILSWILIATSNNVAQIYVARILAGIGSGWTSVSLVYVSEISHVTFRAMLLSCNSVFFSLGILITCILGTFLNWRIMAGVFSFIATVSTLAIMIIPESPHWFTTFKTVDRIEATTSLKWLYRNEQVYEAQVADVMKVSYETTPEKVLTIKENIMEIFKSSNIFKPTVTLLIIFFLQQATGSYVMIFYIIDMFKKVGNNLETSFNEYTCLIILGFIRFIMSIISSIVSKRAGRKKLMYLSCTGMFLSALVIAVKKVFYNDTNDMISVIFVLVYLSFASLGILVIPWTLVSEILPVKLRGKLGGILITYTYLVMFIFVKIFPKILDSVQTEHIFSFFAMICLIFIIFIYTYLPETFSKRFSEIETFYLEKNMFCR